PLPRSRARAAWDPRQRRFRRGRRDRRAGGVPEQGADAARRARAHTCRPHGRGARHRRRGALSGRPARADDLRPDDRRRPRRLAPRLMEPTERNRRAWNEIHRRRAEAMKGELGLPPIVRGALGDLKGRRILNLQCATGESAAELAELGGLVTGVDISSEALDVARERWPDIAWVQADVHDLPTELKRGRFDLVYTAEGVLAWLHDLSAWADGIVAALRSGGDFLLYEEHPV